MGSFFLMLKPGSVRLAKVRTGFWPVILVMSILGVGQFLARLADAHVDRDLGDPGYGHDVVAHAPTPSMAAVSLPMTNT